MSETKHTPGPWFAVEYSGYWNLQGEDYYDEHDDLLDADKIGVEKAEANALLAAAAPQLLKALEKTSAIISAWEGHRENPEIAFGRIKTLINHALLKAKGGTQ